MVDPPVLYIRLNGIAATNNNRVTFNVQSEIHEADTYDRTINYTSYNVQYNLSPRTKANTASNTSDYIRDNIYIISSYTNFGGTYTNSTSSYNNRSSVFYNHNNSYSGYINYGSGI